VNRSENPSKWLRKAPKVSWYQELVEAPAGTVEKKYKPATDLYRARQVGCEQYGAKMAMTVIHQAIQNNQSVEQEAVHLFLQMAQFLKEEHLDQLRHLCRTSERDFFDKLLKDVLADGAVYGERFAPEICGKRPAD